MGDIRKDKEVSPYLQRPLRSYEQAIREAASRRTAALVRMTPPRRPSNSNEPQDKKSG